MDLINGLKFTRALSPVSGAADNTAQTSEVVDRAGYSRLAFAILTGAIADADATFAVEVQHGDESDGSDMAAAEDKYLLGYDSSETPETDAGFQFDDDNETRKIGYVGPKRYVRVKITPSNNTGAWLVAVVAILGGARHQPVS